MPHDTAVDVPARRESLVTAPPPPPPAPAPPQHVHPRPVNILPPSQREQKPAGLVTWIVWIIVLSGLGVGGYFIYRQIRNSQAASATTKPTDRTAGKPIPVLAAKARLGNMSIYLNGLGAVQALNTVTCRTRIDGQIDTVYFVEGDIVHTGDVLFQIDPRPYEVQLEQAQGQLAKDQSILANAQNDLKRNLDAGEAVPAITIDQQKALVAQAQAAVKIDEGQINSAKLNLTYTQITAPLTGRIGLRMVDRGNMVHASDQAGLAVITQIQPIGVVFNLPEDNLPQVRAHMKPHDPAALDFLLPPLIQKTLRIPTLRVEAYDRDMQKQIAVGRLLAIDSQIDPTTGTVRMKGVFLNIDESLFPNQFVNARLLVDTLKKVVIVPTAAVQQSPSGTFVYVIKSDKTVEMRPVTIGPTEGEETVILTGLRGGPPQAVNVTTPGVVDGTPTDVKVGSRAPTTQETGLEIVVTDGVDKLQNGSKVIPRFDRGIKPTTAPTTQAAAGDGAPGDPAKHRQGGKPVDGSAHGDRSGEAGAKPQGAP